MDSTSIGRMIQVEYEHVIERTTRDLAGREREWRVSASHGAHRDLFPRYGPWDFTGALIGFVGRRQQWHPGHSARRPPPPVNELAGDECSQRMDLIGQGPEGWDNGVVPVIDVAGTSRRRRVHAGGAKNLHQGRS